MQDSPRAPRWPGFLGLAVSAGLLWWVLHDVRLADVALHARQAGIMPLAAAVVLATGAFVIRAVRWRYLLAFEGGQLPFIPLWHATAIGFMANNLLPARAGELARAYAVRRLTGVRLSTAIGSVAVERVLDGLVLVGLLAVAIVWGGLAASTTVGGMALSRVAGIAAAVFGPALVIAIWVVHWPGPALRLARGLFARTLPETWALRLMRFVEGVLSGFDALKSPARLARITLWSLVLWLVAAVSYWLAFRAFDISVHWTSALLLQSLIAFGVAIPSSPGFFGPFEAVTRAVLAVYGVPAALSVSYAVTYHLAVFVPITVLGLWSLSRAHLHLADLRKDQETSRHTAERHHGRTA